MLRLRLGRSNRGYQSERQCPHGRVVLSEPRLKATVHWAGKAMLDRQHLLQGVLISQLPNKLPADVDVVGLGSNSENHWLGKLFYEKHRRYISVDSEITQLCLCGFPLPLLFKNLLNTVNHLIYQIIFVVIIRKPAD